MATYEKSNEITAIPELLKLVDVSGAIITIDALGTQTAIVKQIVDGGGDYVLALKGNQGTLHQAVIDSIDEQVDKNFAGARQQTTTDSGHATTDSGHGREEMRTYMQLPVPQDLPGRERWTGLKTIGLVVLNCLRDGKETTDIRYYLSSLPLGVKRFARAVRAHWGIENSCHWNLDVTYREDDSRIRETHLRENFAWLNRFTLSLLKHHPAKHSLVMKRRSSGWNDNFLAEVLTGQTT